MLGAVGWINYGDRITRKLGLTDYEMSGREQYIIKGWTKSLADYTADVVFFGDSITCGGDWNEYFEDLTVCNLAVPGDSIEEGLYRTEAVANLEPEKIFVMIGVNNISRSGYEENISEKYRELIEEFSDTGAEIYIQSILPVREPSEVSNERIDTVNEILMDIAEEYSCTYIDLHTSFSDENGELIEEYSKDGTHINEKGYELWVSLIEEYVE